MLNVCSLRCSNQLHIYRKLSPSAVTNAYLFHTLPHELNLPAYHNDIFQFDGEWNWCSTASQFYLSFTFAMTNSSFCLMLILTYRLAIWHFRKYSVSLVLIDWEFLGNAMTMITEKSIKCCVHSLLSRNSHHYVSIKSLHGSRNIQWDRKPVFSWIAFRTQHTFRYVFGLFHFT